MTSTRRALLFAPYFLPRRRVGSMRPFRFAIHLKEFGWEPTVLTIAAPDQHLTPKEERLLRGVEIIEIRSPFDRTSTSESQLGAEEDVTSVPPGAETPPAARHRSGRAGGNFLHTLDKQFPTDTWLLLFAARYRELRRIVQRVRPDVIWCTGDPWSALVVTRQLAKHFKLAWVADFRDPWTISELRTKGKWPLSRRMDEYLERKIIKSADLVMFQAGNVEQAYRRHYAAEEFATKVITNSYDPNVFDDAIRLDAGSAKALSTDDSLHVAFFGRFRSMSPASLIVDALSAARHRDPERARRIYIHSFGMLNETDAAYAKVNGVEASFVREEAVPLEQSIAVLRRFDLLLVSTDVSRHQIIPAKIFEYLPAGRPILSLSRNAEVAQILNDTGTGIQLDPLHPEAVGDFLLSCLRASEEGQPMPVPYHPNPKAIAAFDARETTRALADVFDEIMVTPR